MVEFVDGATIAQLSRPTCACRSASRSERPTVSPRRSGRSTGRPRHARPSSRPTATTFRCLALAYEAGRAGGTAPAILSAANEIAVEAFLARAHPWRASREIVEEVLSAGARELPMKYPTCSRADAVARRTRRWRSTEGVPREGPVRGSRRHERRAILLTVAGALLLLAYGLVFPTQVAVIGVILTLPLIIMLHEAGHFFDRQTNGYEGHRVLHRLRPAASGRSSAARRSTASRPCCSAATARSSG